MFKVAEKQCDQCLFGKNKIVSNARRKQILSECSEKDTHFNCHKAGGDEVCCRAFFDTRTANLIRIAGRLNMIKFVKVEGV